MIYEKNILFQNLNDELNSYLNENKKKVYIISPFINGKAIENLLGKQKDVIILTSWRKDHLLNGTSKINLFNICKRKNWTLYINDELHLKLFSNDLEDGFIGSPNVTYNALNGKNIEGMFFLKTLSSRDRINILKIFQESVLVTNEVYQKYKKWFDKQEIPDKIKAGKLDLSDVVKKKDFLTSHLPASKSPSRLWCLIDNRKKLEYDNWEIKAMEHDIALYDINSLEDENKFFKELKTKFFTHPFIKELSNEITKEGLRFGGVKEWIQKNCTDVPRPYRRELTNVVQNLYKWFIELGGDKYEIIRPHYSEIIRKK